MSSSGPEHRAGFVALAGRPNAGKSTLLNALVGERIAITAPQAQTTRTSLQGVVSTPAAQIIFIDMPGIHDSGTLLNRRMMETVRGALEGRDLILYLADAGKPPGMEEEHALAALNRSEKTLLVLNKIDQLPDKRQLLPLIERYAALFPFLSALPISARTGDGLEELKCIIVEHLPVSPSLFAGDYLTDQPVRFMVGEIIRERILHSTREEVPHSVAILIDSWEDRPRLTRIAATIYVERPGQKAILIGEKGQLMKRIGTEARTTVERLLGHKVFLALFVKVKPKWREDPEFLAAIDWRAMLGREGPEHG